MKTITYITTTANLNSNEEIAEHLEKFPKYFREDTIEIKGCFRARICDFNHETNKWDIVIKEKP